MDTANKAIDNYLLRCSILYTHTDTHTHIFIYMYVCVYIYIYINICVCVLVAKSCPTLVTPWTVACQASQSMGIL